MQSSFDPEAYVRRVGERLVQQFSDARQATSPSTVGAAMEHPVREQLEQLLPNGIAVGSGFVIDTYGGTSRQLDVVLYEREYCPVFSLNGTPDSTFYPCEGVIAVGEVKSVLRKGDLEDGFTKIASAKSLRRSYDYPKYPDHDGRRVYGYRKYGERAGAIRNSIFSPVNYGPNNSEGSKIYGFILAGELGASEATMRQHYAHQFGSADIRHCPNLTVTLDGFTFEPVRPSGGKLPRSLSTESAAAIAVSKMPSPFPFLVSRIHAVFDNGGTAETEAFAQYYLKLDAVELETTGFFTLDTSYILVEDLFDADQFQDCLCCTCGCTISYDDGGRILDERRVQCRECWEQNRRQHVPRSGN